MATGSFQAYVPFSAVNRRDSAISELQQEIAGRPRWAVDVVEPTLAKTGDPALLVYLWFSTEADRDAVLDWMRARLTGPRIPRDGAWAQVHLCRADEPGFDGNCLILRRWEVVGGSWTRVI